MVRGMVHSILARKRKENKDMEDRINAMIEELRASKVEEGETEKRLAELKANNAVKVMAELDGGIKLRQSKIRTFVSAKIARNIAETTSAFKNHIAKIIEETAKEGMTQLSYFVGDICDIQVNRVINELNELGYEVVLNDKTQELVIKW